MTEQQRLLSHAVNPDSLEIAVKKISARIHQHGDTAFATTQQQLDWLKQLSEFDFGRYLILNAGINGYWTHYMLTYPWFGRKTGKNNRGEPFSDMELFILERAPILLATQQRFQIFLHETQKCVKNNAVLASIPSGMLGELLYLDFQNIDTISLVGVDYDPAAFADAKKLAEQRNLSRFVKLLTEDAWHLSARAEYDLISSNGLSIYEPDDEKVVALYQQFYQALKPGGKLVTSMLTPPPTHTQQCEWDMTKINQHDLLKQKTIFIDMLNSRFQCYRSSQFMLQQLTALGFSRIEFIYDDARIFATVVGYK